MSEFSSACTNAKKKTEHLSGLILSDFMLLCSFIFSHPLYFAYFIFFSPYLFKILSFLSPLFATTFLLLLALFTFTPTLVVHGSNLQFPKSKPSFLLAIYQTFVETSPSEETGQDDDFSCFQVLEAIKMALESPDDIEIQHDTVDDPGEMVPEKTIRPSEPVKDHPELPEAKQVKNLVAFFQEKEKLEKLSGKKCEKEVRPTDTLADKGEEQTEELFKPVRVSKALGGEKVGEARTFTDEDLRSQLRSASSCGSENGDGKHKFNKLTENYSQPLESYRDKIGNFGSMRREKEWRRTLACKLFEERNNGADGGGSEGMDSLWETYEAETTTTKPSHQTQLKSGSKKGKNGRGTYSYDDHQSDYFSANGDHEDYDDEPDGGLCCLQALKFSAGKMNLGMGRPNLVKISKALKGIGWLHHVGGSSPRRAKKSYRH